MKNFTTEFKLQAERRADTPEFYGNRIIAGITREAASSSIASLLSVNAARTINMYKRDIASTLEEALMMPKQNIGFIADYFIPDEILEEISKGLYHRTHGGVRGRDWRGYPSRVPPTRSEPLSQRFGSSGNEPDSYHRTGRQETENQA